MAKREKRQRRLKEHYEEQFGQNFAYRRTVVVRDTVDDDEKNDVDDLGGEGSKLGHGSGSGFDARTLGTKTSQELLVEPR